MFLQGLIIIRLGKKTRGNEKERNRAYEIEIEREREREGEGEKGV